MTFQPRKCPLPPDAPPTCHCSRVPPPLPAPLQPYGPLAGGTLTDKYFGDGQPGPNARHVKVRLGGGRGWLALPTAPPVAGV